MSYLICENCGGYYQLQDNESPEDFELCHCGGNLKHVQYIYTDENIQSEEVNDMIICPICGGETALESKKCAFCGQKLDKSHELWKKDINLKLILIVLTITTITVLLTHYFMERGIIRASIIILIALVIGTIVGIRIRKNRTRV